MDIEAAGNGVFLMSKIRWSSAILGGIAVLLFCQPCFAAPPVNDLCPGAEIIPAAGPFPCFSSVVDVKEATATDDPALAIDCVLGSVSNSVWFSFIPAATGLYTISTGPDAATTVPDTVLVVYTASGPCTGLALWDCNDDQGGLQAALSTTLTANTLYYFVVSVPGNTPLTSPQTTVQIKVSRPVVPANDNCAGAENIPAEGPFPILSGITDNSLASTNGDPAFPACFAHGQRSVWYRFEPGQPATYNFSVASNTATTTYDTLLAVYASPGDCAGPFSPVGCNDNAHANEYRSSATVALSQGTVYYVVVWAWDDPDAYVPGETSIQLRVSQLGMPPLVDTLPAGDITSTGAVLQATADLRNLAGKTWFDWGVTTNYGSTTELKTHAASNLELAVSNAIALPGATTFHFRAAASNDFGQSFGADQVFAWNGTPPQLQPLIALSSGWRLQLNGQSRQVYRVHFSTNLVDWLPLGQMVGNGSGLFSLDDTNPGFLGARFYRALVP